MPPPVALSSHASDVSRSQGKHRGDDMGKSYGKFSVKRDAMTYRQFFAARWSTFIKDNFDSPEHAAMVFGVDGSTARKWFDGSHAPSGFAVGMAYEQFPAEAADKLRVHS